MTRMFWLASALALGIACSKKAEPALEPDAGLSSSSSVDASAPRDAALADSGQDAAPRDAAPVDAALATLQVYPRQGDSSDDTTVPAGPVLALDSGADVATVFGWMQHALFPAGAHGDLVIVNAGGGDRAASILASAPFHSVQTLSLDDGANAADFAAAAAIVAHAEAVWFEGGDQAKYVRWKDSAFFAAVQAVYVRGGAVSGSSAGMIILGSAANDALLTLSENLTTARLLANPFDPELHFTRGVFQLAPLAGTITDPHFSAMDRMGRLVTFVARQVEGPTGFRGVSVDNGVAFAIDAAGVGRRIGAGTGSVYVVRGGVPNQLQAGQPLKYVGLRVRRLAAAEHSYDLGHDCGSALTYTLDVDGSQASPYSTEPYTSGTLASDCP